MAATLREGIIGAWSLVSFQIERSDGETTYPFGEDAIGSIIYTDTGRFSAQVMKRSRPRFALPDQVKGTPEEIKANYEGVVSYFGPFDVNEEEQYVTHVVGGSLFPNWEGDGQQRFATLNGDELRLTTAPVQWGGGQVVAALVWQRVR